MYIKWIGLKALADAGRDWRPAISVDVQMFLSLTDKMSACGVHIKTDSSSVSDIACELISLLNWGIK